MHVLILLALLLFLSLGVSWLCRRIKLPSVVGMIALGIVLGPTVMDVVEPPGPELEQWKEVLKEAEGAPERFGEIFPKTFAFEIVHFIATVGVVMLLFIAGLETDLNRLLRVGTTSVYVAVGGIVVPFGLGFGLSLLFAPENLARAMVVGTILVATSVSISVMSLMGLKKVQSREGTTILTSAIIDDVIGIILLSIVLSFLGEEEGRLVKGLALIAVFLLGACLLGWFAIPFVVNLSRRMDSSAGINMGALSLMFLFAGVAEVSGVAAITGSYLAGLFVGRTQHRATIRESMEIMAHSLFVPVFFVFVGLQTNLAEGTYNWLFIALFVVAAIASKLVGSGLAARMRGFSARSSFAIGAGMVPRGEVALIIALIGMRDTQVLDAGIFTATVIMVVLTSLVTPLMLERAFVEKEVSHAQASD